MTDHLPAALARQVGGRGEISIRPARPADVGDVRRLAHLVARPVPAGPMLLAESDGAVVVALSTATGDMVSDPSGRPAISSTCSCCVQRSCTASPPDAAF